MGLSRRQFSKEFKLKAVQQLEKGVSMQGNGGKALRTFLQEAFHEEEQYRADVRRLRNLVPTQPADGSVLVSSTKG